MPDYDPVSWRPRFDGLLSELPDATAAQRLREARSRILADRAAGTDGLPVMTADSILTATYPEPVWAVPGLLPVGLAILAGRPKVGKSWLALQIAQAVAAGGFALGEHVTQGPVCYLALEDAPRRLQQRMAQQGWPLGLHADFITLGQFAQVGDLCNGGGERLAYQTEREGYRLLVVDTLSRAIDGDQNDVAEMTSALTPLQETAHHFNCCVLLVDHHRKTGGAEPDAVSDVLGSTAKGAMCDTALGLYRQRGKPGAKLAVTGRDIEERTLELRFDSVTACWQLDATEQVTQKQRDLLEALADIAPATTADLAEATGRNKGTVLRQLCDFEARGLVQRDAHKQWSLSDREDDER